MLLLLVNAVAFVAQVFFSGSLQHPTNQFLDQYFALSLEGLKHGYLWQLLTFQFMHGNPLHILINCFVIFMVGRGVEEILGRKNFLLLYLSSGVVGGLFQGLAGALLKGTFADPVVGASAGGFGLVAAFAMLFPDSMFLLFFIIPMRGKFFLVVCGLLAVWGIAFPERSFLGPHVADAAHLGGMLAGIFFVRYAIHWQWPRFRRGPTRPPRRLVKVASRDSALWGRKKDTLEEELPPEEFLSKEVDPILDKISAQGIQSLTEHERRILEAARAKMAKR